MNIFRIDKISQLELSSPKFNEECEFFASIRTGTIIYILCAVATSSNGSAPVT